MIRQRSLLAVVALVGATPTANRLRVRPTRSLSMGAYVRVMAKSANFLTGLTIILVGFVWMLCECGGLCGGWVLYVRVVCVIQLSRSSQASSWLCTKMIFQDLRVLAIASVMLA